MRAIKKFEEFILLGAVKKQSPDPSRASFLLEESNKKNNSLKERLDKLEITDYNAGDFVESCYNIIMLLVRAKMLKNGLNAQGYRAHEAEVSYLRELGFIESEVQFVNQIRYFRNGLLYYGTIIDIEYAKKVLDFFNSLYPKLKKII